MRVAVYVDLDNIYPGIIDKLGISTNIRENTPFQREFFKNIFLEFFTCLSKKLFFTNLSLAQRNESTKLTQSDESSEYNCLCIKAFAEYEKLPLHSEFRPSLQAHLYDAGVIPVHPFVAYTGKRKQSNAADLRLVLTVIEDVIIKKIPVDSILICTGDAGLYPLVAGLKEHTGKFVMIGGFMGRTSHYYDSMSTVDKKVLLDVYLKEALKRTLEHFLENPGTIRCGIKDGDLKFVNQLKMADDQLKNKVLKVLKQITGKVAEKSNCDKFKKKVVKGLQNWLSENPEATTGLIMESWFPKWNINLSLREANECLEELVRSGDLEKHGIAFERSRKGASEGLIVGKFYLI